ncbi:type VII secretion target [Amycolatopsis pittospori]|uniref:type VII secretion target n=1 Tax=Amycolatopsis pittospori TaxID=2749434 RepID=UPI0015F09D89|nr:type VII secretion target [Amycolatopsis pittospori]
MSGYRAEPEQLRVLARRLEDVAGDLIDAARVTDGFATLDLGSPGIATALDGLIRPWTDSIVATHDEVASAAAGIFTAAKSYESTDDDAVRTLKRADGGS